MRYIRLETGSDEYDTSLGFKFKGAGQYEGLMVDRDGMLTAHDILEHQNGAKNIGSIRDEMEALGGGWQVRGRWGDMCREGGNQGPIANFASDFVRMARDGFWENWTPPKQGKRAHLYDDDFRSILEDARPQIRAEIEDMEADDYLQTALQLMRVGFNKAERRFGDRFAGINQFKAIQEAVAKAVKWIDWEGQEYLLAYGNGEAKCYPAEAVDDYY